MELNGVDTGDRFSKNLVFVDVLDESLLLHFEYPSTKVRAVGGSLARKELSRDLWPVRVAGECDEKVNLLVKAGQGECILQALLHVPWTTGVQQQKHNSLANVVEIDVIFYCILDASVGRGVRATLPSALNVINASSVGKLVQLVTASRLILYHKGRVDPIKDECHYPIKH